MNRERDQFVASAGERISDVAQQWFLMEPLLFAIYCTHELKQNNSIKVPLRTGDGRIEYNEDILAEINDAELTGRMMVEALRILLKHPYIRQPFGARAEILYLASNMTILDNVSNSKRFNFELVPLSIKNRLPRNKTFEEYYGLLNRMFPPQEGSPSSNIDKSQDGQQDQDRHGGQDVQGSPDCQDDQRSQDNQGGQDGQGSPDCQDDQRSQDNQGGQDVQGSPDCQDDQRSQDNQGGQDVQGSSDCQDSSCGQIPKDGNSQGKALGLKQKMEEWADAASTWKEDSINTENINTLIESALNDKSKRWGMVKGDLFELIKASLVPPVNVANILKGFKKTTLSQRRDLTRMKPSRRYGFEQMGSKYAYTTRILVAIDTSGSVDSYILTRMLGLVNRIFKQGIEQIDVIQFDFDLQGKPISIKKCIKQFEILGRGGTNFQVPADYYIEHREYDGLIYITDGDAPNPTIPKQYKDLPVTWIITEDDLIPTIAHGWERMIYED